jgi:hypothetical protein
MYMRGWNITGAGYNLKETVDFEVLGLYERLIGTVFQLLSPDAIYSRDEEKKSVGGYPALPGSAHGLHPLGSRGEATRQQPNHVTQGSACYRLMM